MTLSAGTRLGPYEILSALGAGGIGEVYKARDTRLDRPVAIKVLPEHRSGNPQVRERFEREAKAISLLSHPHICPLYDIGQQDGVDYLVMEYLEGETLAYRLKKGALPIDQVLQYAAETADALDTAHHHGVIHRDLKPGNIMLTKTGAKLLDFGLAKVRAAEAVAGATALPTETSPLTGEGAILGTLQYMAPEQLEGKDADARTDIFALGAVIYEMATGRKAFEGKSQASLISAIMASEPPPISGLQVTTPHVFGHVVRTCLAKNPEARWQNVHDVLAVLKWIAEDGTRTGVPFGPRRTRWRPVTLATALLVVLLAISALVRNRFGERPPALRRFTLTLPDGYDDPAISPDDQHVAFVRNDRLWVQDLDREDAKELPGTDGAFTPFWSPDSRTIGFGAYGYLRTAPVNAGPVTTVCRLPGGWQVGVSGAWSPDGQIILFSAGIPAILYEVPASGGEPHALEYPRTPGIGVYAPVFLPGDPVERKILFAEYDAVAALGGARHGAGHMSLLDLRSGKTKVVGSGVPVACSKSGLVLASDGFAARGSGVLRARPFSLAAGQFTEDAVAVAQDANSVSLAWASDDTLVYIEPGVHFRWQLFWRDRRGKQLGAIGQPQQDMWDPSLSPDEKHVAVAGAEVEKDIWIHDSERPLKTRLTFEQEGPLTPLWSSSGDHIFFSSPGEKVWRFLVKPVDGSQPATPVVGAPEFLWGGFSARSADDQYLIYLVKAIDGADIWYLERQADGRTYKAGCFMQTPFDERSGELSPDKRYIVYASNESGRFEVYVRAFPSGAGKWQISRNGGIQPRWSKNGGEIYYVEGKTLIAMKVKTRPAFSPGDPERLFDSEGFRGEAPLGSQYDVGRDGRRFVTMEQIETTGKNVIRVVQNWQVGLLKRQK
jgi:serine/threonine protein kinase/Tol biopolymer transport system component